MPALHVLTFRTSGSFLLRTSDSFLLRTSDSYWLRTFASFQPRTIGNLEEVELWVTAGILFFSHRPRKGSNHAYSAKKNRSSLRTSLSNSSRKSHRLCHSLWFMMYCVTTSFPDIEAVAVHERRQRKRSRQLHQHTHVVLCGSTPFEVDVRERG